MNPRSIVPIPGPQTAICSACALLLVAAFATGCQEEIPEGGTVSGSQFEIVWTVLDNYEDNGASLRSALTIRNNGPVPLGATGWELYFSFVRPVMEETVSPEAQIRHINGDFHVLAPTPDFGVLREGDERTLTFKAQHSVVKKSEAPAGYYFVFKDDGIERVEGVIDVSVGPFESERQWNRNPDDRTPVPTAETRFRANEKLLSLPTGSFGRVVPTPLRSSFGQDTVHLSEKLVLQAPSGLQKEAEYLADLLTTEIGLETEITNSRDAEHDIAIRANPQLSMGREGCAAGESYRLTIRPGDGVLVDGSNAAGVFRGIQTFLLLIDPWEYDGDSDLVVLPETVIEDCPRFRYRGLMVDVARNFHSKEQLMKLMDLMALYKLNRLHLHLVDDEGWRFEVQALPELTTLGARRGHTETERDHLVPSYGSGPDPDNSAGSGYYSRADFVDLIRYATRHHIQVIPEIDLPGHARAAIKSMDERYRRFMERGREDAAIEFLLSEAGDVSDYRSAQNWNDNVINVCSSASYRFVEAIIDELVFLYDEAGSKLRVIHFGADEVPEGAWEGSPMCRELIASEPDLEGVEDLTGYFFGKVVDILEERDLYAAGWEEIALGARVDSQYDTEAPRAFQDRVVPYVWNSVWGWGQEERAYLLANAGYRVVLANAPNLYFDLAYEKHPEEPGYMWAGFVNTRKPFEFTPMDIYKSAYVTLMGDSIDAATAYADATRLTEEGKKNILGIQGQIWGEKGKSKEDLEFLVFPKMLALAERAWAPIPNWARLEKQSDRMKWLDTDWNQFANRLGKNELVRMSLLGEGVGFRIPPPGAILENGTLRANVAFPGMTIRYTTDGSIPDSTSSLYTGPVEGVRRANVRVFDASGRGGRIANVGT